MASFNEGSALSGAHRVGLVLQEGTSPVMHECTLIRRRVHRTTYTKDGLCPMDNNISEQREAGYMSRERGRVGETQEY